MNEGRRLTVLSRVHFCVFIISARTIVHPTCSVNVQSFSKFPSKSTCASDLQSLKYTSLIRKLILNEYVFLAHKYHFKHRSLFLVILCDDSKLIRLWAGRKQNTQERVVKLGPFFVTYSDRKAVTKQLLRRLEYTIQFCFINKAYISESFGYL